MCFQHKYRRLICLLLFPLNYCTFFFNNLKNQRDKILKQIIPIAIVLHKYQSFHYIVQIFQGIMLEAFYHKPILPRFPSTL